MNEVFDSCFVCSMTLLFLRQRPHVFKKAHGNLRECSDLK